MKTIILTIAYMYFGLTIYAQSAIDLNIDYMLRGNKYVASCIKDSNALGGFAHSENTPKILNDSNNFIEKGFFLKIDTTSIITISKKYNGYNFYIVNKSDSTIKLNASDSRISVVLEAYVDKKWQEIEYLPSSWWGNSRHKVFIRSNECWKFSIPKFTGQIKTTIRYKLIIGLDQYIYSNAIVSSINRKQLTERQGYQSQGIMDPYED
ncbi:MAG: hypothetical protein SGJ10_00810 [Bacteroidota bacterium]|nr:hypothetical protein [Bacteroidota bacterium]